MKLEKQMIDTIFSQTPNKYHSGTGDDMRSINNFREFYKDYYRLNKDRYKYFLENAPKYMLNLMLNAELDDKLIENNLKRFGFLRDRGFYNEKGEYVEDIWFSTFMVLIYKIYTEMSTLDFFRKGKFDFYIRNNQNATEINSTNNITGENDFYIVLEDEKEFRCEQKFVTNENYHKISIRKSQFGKFNQMVNNGETVIILVKSINLKEQYITYSFYNYIDIMDKLNWEVNGYKVLNTEVTPFKIIKDFYGEGKTHIYKLIKRKNYEGGDWVYELTITK